MKKKKIVMVIVAVLLFIGVIYVFRPFARVMSKKYSTWGIDVSHYQGEVDWKKVKERDVNFVYIKATEGTSHVDECFEKNKKQLEENGLTYGVYHFFSFDSKATEQAKHFIKTIGDMKGNLVPVVDVEYYGDKKKHPPKKKNVQKQLQKMLDILEEEYGVKPMIYSTEPFYIKYLDGDFDDYPLWIRNVYFEPVHKWKIWQYSDKYKMDGINGIEKYVDVNVCKGDLDELIVGKNN